MSGGMHYVSFNIKPPGERYPPGIYISEKQIDKK
jgi:hypothetical protein